MVRGYGPVFPVPGYPAGPPPAHRVEIWLGVYGPRGLKLAGRTADGWIPSLGYVGLDDVKRASAVIDEAAIAAARDPADITRLLNFNGVIGEGERGEIPLVGPVDHWVDTLSRWATEIGTDSFILYPNEGSAEQVRRFAAEVAPGVRERLGR